MVRTYHIILCVLFAYLTFLLIPISALASCSSALSRNQLSAAKNLLTLNSNVVSQAQKDELTKTITTANKRCSLAQLAYALTLITVKSPSPSTGSKANVAGMSMIAQVDNENIFWRLDVASMAKNINSRSLHNTQKTLRLMFPTTVNGSYIWSSTPAAPTWDPALQAQVISILSTNKLATAYTVKSISAFMPESRRNSLRNLSLLKQLTISEQLTRASIRAKIRQRTAANKVTLDVYKEVNKATSIGSWSRIDNNWATRTQHLALLKRTASLYRLLPNPLAKKVVLRLRSQLTTPADIRFKNLPSEIFYPWPEDGAFDTQKVTIHVDKPGEASIEIFSDQDTPVTTVTSTVLPGLVDLVWNGKTADGTILGEGEYPYVIVTKDINGHVTRTPSLEPFKIAKDTTPPKVKKALVSYSNNAPLGPRVVASWDIEEIYSPIVKTQLLLKRGARQITVLLSSQEQTSSMYKQLKLGAGSWQATFKFTDGSGNLSTQDAGFLTIK